MRRKAGFIPAAVMGRGNGYGVVISHQADHWSEMKAAGNNRIAWILQLVTSFNYLSAPGSQCVMD